MVKVKLRKLLHERGITQAELAQQTHIRPSTISALCSGSAISLKFSHITAICKALDCKIEDIFTVL